MLMQDWCELEAQRSLSPLSAGVHRIVMHQEHVVPWGTNQFEWFRSLTATLPGWRYSMDFHPENDASEAERVFDAFGFMDDFGSLVAVPDSGLRNMGQELMEWLLESQVDYESRWKMLAQNLDDKNSVVSFLSWYGYEYEGYWITKVGELPTELPKEHGWEELLPLASTDGMLCVRWLNWYEKAPGYYSYQNVRDQGHAMASRQVRFEGVVFRSREEVAAEVFPVEIGSIQSRYYKRLEYRISIGLVLDWDLTDIRQIYSRDCYSDRGRSGRLYATRRQDECWSQAEAKACYYSVDSWKRQKHYKHTEAFVGDRRVGAVVVYGATQEEFLQYADEKVVSLMLRLKRQRLPVFFMATEESA